MLFVEDRETLTTLMSSTLRSHPAGNCRPAELIRPVKKLWGMSKARPSAPLYFKASMRQVAVPPGLKRHGPASLRLLRLICKLFMSATFESGGKKKVTVSPSVIPRSGRKGFRVKS
jgi:hypothetical protein